MRNVVNRPRRTHWGPQGRPACVPDGRAGWPASLPVPVIVGATSSMHRRHRGRPAAFLGDICLQRRHLRISGVQRIAFQRAHNAPVDHLPDFDDFAQLLLKPGIGFRLRMGRVRVTLIARYRVLAVQPPSNSFSPVATTASYSWVQRSRSACVNVPARDSDDTLSARQPTTMVFQFVFFTTIESPFIPPQISSGSAAESDFFRPGNGCPRDGRFPC
jgi:hypothetical protein